jgi:hypothetical protein
MGQTRAGIRYIYLVDRWRWAIGIGLAPVRRVIDRGLMRKNGVMMSALRVGRTGMCVDFAVVTYSWRQR